MDAETGRALRQLPQLPMWPPSCRPGPAGLAVEIDRDAASRVGVTVAAIDNALYNAFGQRLISTIFTQASQYRVVLEVQKPAWRRQPDHRSGRSCADLRAGHRRGSHVAQVPLSSIAAGVVERPGRASGQQLNQFPDHRCRSTSRRAFRWATP